MANKQESERIAASINILRPDWSTGLILAVLGDDRCIRRGYADLAIAMTCVAVDPVSKKPGRIHENGPWWNASLATSPRPEVKPIKAADCAICFWPKGVAHVDHLYEPLHMRSESVGVSDEQRAAIIAAAVAAEFERTAAHEAQAAHEPKPAMEAIENNRAKETA